jgi:transcriptional regulator
MSFIINNFTQQQQKQIKSIFLLGAATASLATICTFTYRYIKNYRRRVQTPKGETSVLFIPPRYEKSHDVSLCLSVIEENSFATLISVSPGDDPVIYTSTIPMILKHRDEVYYLEFHLALGNPHVKVLEQYGKMNNQQQQWKHMVLFNGPHGYISPTLYPEQDQTKSVPTWNYIQVQVESKSIERMSDEGLESNVKELSQIYETKRSKHGYDAYTFDNVESKTRSTLLKGIVGFKLCCDGFKGKFKLSQNKTQPVIQRVIAGLYNQSEKEVTDSTKLAMAMEKISIQL